MADSCVLTLGGQCCNDLSQITTFITSLKDLNLSEYGKRQCC